jgi:hypothetical protein
MFYFWEFVRSCWKHVAESKVHSGSARIPGILLLVHVVQWTLRIILHLAWEYYSRESLNANVSVQNFLTLLV